MEEIIETIANSQKQSAVTQSGENIHPPDEEDLPHFQEEDTAEFENEDENERLPSYSSAVNMKQMYLEELQETTHKSEAEDNGDMSPANRIIKDVIYESDEQVENAEVDDDYETWRSPV